MNGENFLRDYSSDSLAARLLRAQQVVQASLVCGGLKPKFPRIVRSRLAPAAGVDLSRLPFLPSSARHTVHAGHSESLATGRDLQGPLCDRSLVRRRAQLLLAAQERAAQGRSMSSTSTPPWGAGR